MIAVLQRVKEACVYADGELSGSCGQGLFILLGVLDGDSENDALILAEKISKMRIFSDENDKMNLSVKDIGGAALVVSNFTLGANYVHGNRPDYLSSAKPDVACPLYEKFVSLLSERIGEVATGRFGADMKIDASLDGPVTIVVDSLKLRKDKR